MKKVWLLLSCLVVGLLIGGTVVSAYYSLGSPSGFVNDYAGILSSEARAALEEKLSQFEKDTSNEISVVIIRSLGGDTIENFAERLFQEWKIGKKDKDNGILFIAAIDDRKMRIEVGYGLEGTLTDAQSYWILQNEAQPAFRVGDYVKGINATVDKIVGAIGGGEVVPTGRQNYLPKAINWSSYLWLFFFGALVMVVYFGGWLARSKSWWGGGIVGLIMGSIFLYTFGISLIILLLVIFLVLFGLFFDYFASKNRGDKNSFWHWLGSGRGGFGGGFGGFGGGRSGGGGSSSDW